MIWNFLEKLTIAWFFLQMNFLQLVQTIMWWEFDDPIKKKKFLSSP